MMVKPKPTGEMLKAPLDRGALVFKSANLPCSEIKLHGVTLILLFLSLEFHKSRIGEISRLLLDIEKQTEIAIAFGE